MISNMQQIQSFRYRLKILQDVWPEILKRPEIE
jgi:hypothetical protein